MKNKFSFSKAQRLSSASAIKKLFESKSVIKQYPLLFQYYTLDASQCHQIIPVVSKRKFKKAVDRNRLKRQIREAWRLNCHQMPVKNNDALALAIIFMANKKLPYQDIESAIISFIKKVNEIA
jgi:ribonuclease P protein component